MNSIVFSLTLLLTGLDVPDIGVDTDEPDQTLDPSDADFVDETHTQWSWTSKGHVDFFPNGGLQMPGCKKMGRKLVDSIKAILNGGLQGMVLNCNIANLAFRSLKTVKVRVVIGSQPSLWRNWLARSAVNRKVGGSSPPRDVIVLTHLQCFGF